ncbi:MAG: hypothetical protein ACYTGL_31195 [Planctomycetota bacterium]|jgi:hypothetical protein
MTCDEFQKQIEDAIDSRLDGEQLAESCAADGHELAAHAAGCAACRERWQEFQLLEIAVSAWRGSPRTPKLSDEFTDRVLRELKAGRAMGATAGSPGSAVFPAQDTAGQAGSGTRSRPDAGEQTAKPIRAWEIVLTVALVLVAVFVVFRDDGSQLAHDDSVPEQPGPFDDRDSEEVADLTDLLSDARMALSSMTERASEKAGRFRVFVPDVSSGLGFEGSSLAPLSSQPSVNGNDVPEPEDHGPGINAESGRLKRALDFLFEVAGPTDQQTT